MEFRPCIDIHDGKVKQIVGGSLDDSKGASENFVSTQDALFYAEFYRKYGITGGHIIMLNKSGTPEYELTKAQAIGALGKYKNALQIGGGITAENALEFINAGASHVIVTSYVFKDGEINYENLKKLVGVAGKEHVVLDLSCRKKDGKYYIVTDRWQKFTDTVLDKELLVNLEQYADEYLIHAVDVEGKASGPDDELIAILGEYAYEKCKGADDVPGRVGIPVTYAGGISSYEDIEKIKNGTNGSVNITIGSALDLFGGKLDFKTVLDKVK